MRNVHNLTASTIFGPYTLDTYIEKYGSLVDYLAPGSAGTPPSDAPPVEQTSKAISLQTGVVVDNPPPGRKFGDVLIAPLATYKAGDSVVAQFVAANPRNNLRLEQTFLTVDRFQDDVWTPVRSDSHPSTKFEWLRTNGFVGYSTINITWVIEPGTPAGTYRFSYFGDAKPLIGNITPFVGRTDSFTLS